MGAGRGGQWEEGRGRMAGDAPTHHGARDQRTHRNQRLAYQRMTPTPRVSATTFAWRERCDE